MGKVPMVGRLRVSESRTQFPVTDRVTTVQISVSLVSDILYLPYSLHKGYRQTI